MTKKQIFYRIVTKAEVLDFLKLNYKNKEFSSDVIAKDMKIPNDKMSAVMGKLGRDGSLMVDCEYYTKRKNKYRLR